MKSGLLVFMENLRRSANTGRRLATTRTGNKFLNNFTAQIKVSVIYSLMHTNTMEEWETLAVSVETQTVKNTHMNSNNDIYCDWDHLTS